MPSARRAWARQRRSPLRAGVARGGSRGRETWERQCPFGSSSICLLGTGRSPPDQNFNVTKVGNFHYSQPTGLVNWIVLKGHSWLLRLCGEQGTTGQASRLFAVEGGTSHE